jgi:hypothetical protein
MADEAKLQIHQFFELTSRSLSCTVRCLSGVVRVGDSVRLVSRAADRPLAEGLTISYIEFAGDIPMEFIDLGRTALVTATGAIDDAAVRAEVAGTAPDELFRLGLLFVAR